MHAVNAGPAKHPPPPPQLAKSVSATTLQKRKEERKKKVDWSSYNVTHNLHITHTRTAGMLHTYIYIFFNRQTR